LRGNRESGGQSGERARDDHDGRGCRDRRATPADTGTRLYRGQGYFFGRPCPVNVHVELPSYGSRRMTFALNAENCGVIPRVKPGQQASTAADAGDGGSRRWCRVRARAKPRRGTRPIPTCRIISDASAPLESHPKRATALWVRLLPYRSRASSSASKQKPVSMVFDRRHARTARLAQSMIATRYRKPCAALGGGAHVLLVRPKPPPGQRLRKSRRLPARLRDPRLHPNRHQTTRERVGF
jgi:hypothetical protein